MKIVVEAYWDDQAGVWTASAVGDVGLVTEAPTIEELQKRIALVLPDLLEGDQRGPFEVELVARSYQVIAAE